MAVEVTLSSAVRSSLLSLAGTENLIARTQNRLSSGLKVASPIDNARIFFEAKGLNDRSSDFSEKKDGIDQGISSLSAALESVEAVDSLVNQLKGLANQAKSASTSERSDSAMLALSSSRTETRTVPLRGSSMPAPHCALA